MRHQTAEMLDEVANGLLNARWNLILTAAFCFGMALYNFVTPAWGGLGLFMITPRDGLAGICSLMPWCAIALGAARTAGSCISRSGWVLSWCEIALSLVMLAFGLGELLFPSVTRGYAALWAVVGVFMAFELVLVALDMGRRGLGYWWAELAVAAAVWAVAFAGALGFAGAAGAQGTASLMLFVAGWGYVYGAVVLHGAGSAERGGAAAAR